jgi:hypothetical protein
MLVYVGGLCEGCSLYSALEHVVAWCSSYAERGVFRHFDGVETVIGFQGMSLFGGRRILSDVFPQADVVHIREIKLSRNSLAVLRVLFFLCTGDIKRKGSNFYKVLNFPIINVQEERVGIERREKKICYE